jgi:hypothetical protein
MILLDAYALTVLLAEEPAASDVRQLLSVRGFDRPIGPLPCQETRKPRYLQAFRRYRQRDSNPCYRRERAAS